MGFYYIGSLQGRKFYLAQSSSPEATLRKVKSNFKHNVYEGHKLLGGLQKDFRDFGEEDLFFGAYQDGKLEPKIKQDLERTHKAVSITDIRNLDKEIPERYERILKKTIEVLDQGLISEDDLENYIDKA